MSKAYIFYTDIAYLGRIYYGARICDADISTGKILPSVDYLKYGVLSNMQYKCQHIPESEKLNRPHRNRKRMIILSNNPDLIADLYELYCSYQYQAYATINAYNYHYRKYALELRIPGDYVPIVEEVLRLERITPELGGGNHQFNYYIFENSIEDNYSKKK